MRKLRLKTLKKVQIVVPPANPPHLSVRRYSTLLYVLISTTSGYLRALHDNFLSVVLLQHLAPCCWLAGVSPWRFFALQAPLLPSATSTLGYTEWPLLEFVSA